MRKKAELVILILLIAGLILTGRNLGEYVSSGKVEPKEKKIVIDAGHGGRDPGKVGVNEIQEKDINLAIAQKIREKLEEKGITVIMTREKDETLAPEGSANKQVEDIKKRVKIIDEAAPALAVSIHQNSYHESSVQGAQVFYYNIQKKEKKRRRSCGRRFWRRTREIPASQKPMIHTISCEGQRRLRSL